MIKTTKDRDINILSPENIDYLIQVHDHQAISMKAKIR